MRGILPISERGHAAVECRARPRTVREASARLIIYGAWLMPLGFFAGGVLGAEGDPSLGVLLVPLGGVLLLIALFRAALSARA